MNTFEDCYAIADGGGAGKPPPAPPTPPPPPPPPGSSYVPGERTKPSSR